MIERLIENWLDSASERSYQACFCQMLVGQGHTVVHSTRHSPIEFGKDVISIAPDGVPCAFQLKGNPGSRLSQSEMRDILPQLIQMATQAIVFPGIPVVPHRSYLVTNGFVEEEAARIVDDTNLNFRRQKLKCKILIIDRGDLLSQSQKLGARLWPSELSEFNALLQLLLCDGKDLYPVHILHRLLVKILFLAREKHAVTSDEMRRRVTSAALITGISLQNFHREQNHYALITAWTMFFAYAAGCCERYRLPNDKRITATLNLAEDEIYGSLWALCREAQSRTHLVEGDPLTDMIAYRWRYTTLVGLSAILWLWIRERRLSPDPESVRGLEHFLAGPHTFLDMWSEGAIPLLLALDFYDGETKASRQYEQEITGLLGILVARNGKKGIAPIPNPYVGITEASEKLLDLIGGMPKSQRMESFRGSSFYARSLFSLLVRTNMKELCKDLWPAFSHLGHKEFVPDQKWQFSLYKSESGEEVTKQFPRRQTWETIVEEARDVSCRGVPSKLKGRPHILFLFVSLFPYRGTPAGIRYLAWCFSKIWLIPPPIRR